MIKLGFGKHAEDDIETVPAKYLFWLIDNSQEKIDICKAELDRRNSKIDNSVMARIVTAGTKELLALGNNDSADITRARNALMKAITDASGEDTQ